MIREWVTIVLWQNRQALVSRDVKASCSNRAPRVDYGNRVLSRLGPQITHTIVVPCDKPLVPGQKMGLGIVKGSPFSSALLVHMLPLMGSFFIASLFQLLFVSDITALCGVVLDGTDGLLIVCGYSHKSVTQTEW